MGSSSCDGHLRSGGGGGVESSLVAMRHSWQRLGLLSSLDALLLGVVAASVRVLWISLHLPLLESVRSQHLLCNVGKQSELTNPRRCGRA